MLVAQLEVGIVTGGDEVMVPFDDPIEVPGVIEGILEVEIGGTDVTG